MKAEEKVEKKLVLLLQLVELRLVQETLDCGQIVLGYNDINKVRRATTLNIVGGNGRAASNIGPNKRVGAIDFVNENAVDIEHTITSRT